MKPRKLSGGVLQTNAGIVSASAFWKARALSAELRTFAVIVVVMIQSTRRPNSGGAKKYF
jgi:hypothetical protein